eukprot:14540577-Ditylum_brightwellii.AAC.1
MAPPMSFQNLTNTQGLQSYKKQKKQAQKAIAGLMGGASIKETFVNPNLMDTVIKQLRPTIWEEMIMAVNDSMTVAPPQQTHSLVAKANSGASSHYFTLWDKHVLYGRQQLTHGPWVKLLNNQELYTTEVGHIPLHPASTPDATSAYVLPNVTNAS